jgi:hypothetical protein
MVSLWFPLSRVGAGGVFNASKLRWVTRSFLQLINVWPLAYNAAAV